MGILNSPYLTLALLIGFIALAWFSYQHKYDLATYGYNEQVFKRDYKKQPMSIAEARAALKQLYGDRD